MGTVPRPPRQPREPVDREQTVRTLNRVLRVLLAVGWVAMILVMLLPEDVPTAVVQGLLAILSLGAAATWKFDRTVKKGQLKPPYPIESYNEADLYWLNKIGMLDWAAPKPEPVKRTPPPLQAPKGGGGVAKKKKKLSTPSPAPPVPPKGGSGQSKMWGGEDKPKSKPKPFVPTARHNPSGAVVEKAMSANPTTRSQNPNVWDARHNALAREMISKAMNDHDIRAAFSFSLTHTGSIPMELRMMATKRAKQISTVARGLAEQIVKPTQTSGHKPSAALKRTSDGYITAPTPIDYDVL